MVVGLQKWVVMTVHEFADKTIHTKSFPHVETERLVARLEFLRRNLRTITLDKSREDFRSRVREVVNCERELTRRDVAFVLVTDGQHLDVNVFDVRLIRPFTRAETVYGRSEKA